MLYVGFFPPCCRESAIRPNLQCRTCRKVYSGNDTHLDLTITSGSKGYGEARPASTELFR